MQHQPTPPPTNQTSQHPLPGVAVIVHDEYGRIVMGQPVAQAASAKHWRLPGTLIFVGEDYRAAAIRSVAEATGLPIEPSGVYAVISSRLDNAAEVLMIVMLAMVDSHTRLSSDIETVRWQWVEPGQNLAAMAHQADRQVIQRFWSGEWSVISKNAGFFMGGDGI